jgi:hypothetical protein
MDRNTAIARVKPTNNQLLAAPKHKKSLEITQVDKLETSNAKKTKPGRRQPPIQ